MNNYNDRLLFGKNPLERLVNLEVENDKVILFIEDKDGRINKEERSNRSWILYHNPMPGSVKLQGELYYQYGRQFTTRKSWFDALQASKKTEHFTIYDAKESCQVKDGYTFYKGMTHKEPSILSFDIESTGLFHNEDSKVLLISNTFRKNNVITRKLFCYDEYASQGEMLVDWCNWVRTQDPSIICGHNIYSYDIPYLQFIAKKEGVELKLGRNGSAIEIKAKPSQKRIDGNRSQEYHRVRIYGRDVIDTMFVAINYDIASKKYDSYGLKAIIKQEGLEKTDRVHYDSSKIRFNYKDPVEWEKIKAYCEHDADDSLALYDLMAPAFFYLTQSIPKTFQQVIESATGSQINAMMIRSYLQEGHSLPKAHRAVPFEGAISLGNSGIYRNVHKVDVASLYPSIILECKVYDENKDPKGNFLKIMEKFTEERLKNKKLAKDSPYHDALQNSQKIVINSGYGFMGADGLLFNSPSAAEFITKTGREILQTALDWATKKGFKIVNADTDSISYCKPNGEEISTEEREALLNELNALFPRLIHFEHDGDNLGYYPTVVILKAKNYILFDGKKIKMKGNSLKATGKGTALKEMLKRVVDSIVYNKGDIQSIYLEYIKEAAQVKDMKRWASRKTISDKTLTNDRTNEVRIRDAIAGSEYVEGDRVWLYNKTKTELALVEKFDGIYDVDKILNSVYDTIWVFENVLDCESLFKNYKLKKWKKELEELLNERSQEKQINLVQLNQAVMA